MSKISKHERASNMARKLKDYPEIGDRHNGHTLVAMGDDFPDQWISWLDDLLAEYGEMVQSLESIDLSVPGLDLSDLASSKMEFAESLGVSFSSSFWEGDHISGQFQMGWMANDEIPKAKKAGKLLLKQRMNLIRCELTKKLVSNLKRLDINELVARISFDPIDQNAEIDHLREAKKLAEESCGEVTNLLDLRIKEASALAIASQQCIALAVSLHNPSDKPIAAGPIALWQGEIFAICSQGGVHPPASPYDDLKRCLAAAGRMIVELRDETIVGRSPFSGSVALLKGSGQLSDWLNIWSSKLPYKRILKANTDENSQKATDLHDILSAC
jgi:hypothetical protein